MLKPVYTFECNCKISDGCFYPCNTHIESFEGSKFIKLSDNLTLKDVVLKVGKDKKVKSTLIFNLGEKDNGKNQDNQKSISPKRL